MTIGPEAAAGRAIAAVGKAALSEDEAVKAELLRQASDDPAMGRAVEAYAKRVAVKQEILLKLYKPLARLMGVSRDYFDSENANGLAADLAAKTADIPEEHLRTPAGHLALPAMQGLSYVLDEPALKDMYLNLLAAATDDRRNDDAHPSFAEIIRQLSPTEARLLRRILSQDSIPVVRLNQKETPGFIVRTSNLMDWRNTESLLPVKLPSAEAYVDNWQRLGLASVTYAEHRSDDDAYAWVKERPEYLELEAEGIEIEIGKGLLRITSFGKRFAAAVMPQEGVA